VSSRFGAPRPRAVNVLALLLVALACAALSLPVRAAAGPIVADSGFRPDPNGFSFANYGDEEGYLGLDSREMQRIFGPAVCLSGKGSRCVLTPTARAWMHSQNAGMAGGHCYGFATLAELIDKGQLAEFGFRSLAALGGGASVPYELQIESNRRLQRTIARAFVLQELPAVSAGTVIGTPRRVLAQLRADLTPESSQSWTLGIFQRGFKGGHAITPYAVERQGKGVFDVHVYDNNWPGDGDRRLRIDTRANSWRYYAATKPGDREAVYVGDAKTATLRLMPVQQSLGVQPCWFCVGRQGLGSKFNEIRLDGGADEHARLLIVDDKGRKTGFVGRRAVNQIPGAKMIPRASGGAVVSASGEAEFRDSPEPVYRVPRDTRFRVRIDGRQLDHPVRQVLSVVGPTYDATIEDIEMGPRERAEVRLAPRSQRLTYRSSDRTETPVVALGAESKKAAYKISIEALDAPRGSTISMVKRPSLQLLWFGDETDQRRAYRLTIERYTSRGREELTRSFSIVGGQQAFLYYGPLAQPRGVPKIVIYTPSRDRIRTLPVR
jgi:hypothetical protein